MILLFTIPFTLMSLYPVWHYENKLIVKNYLLFIYLSPSNKNSLSLHLRLLPPIELKRRLQCAICKIIWGIDMGFIFWENVWHFDASEDVTSIKSSISLMNWWKIWSDRKPHRDIEYVLYVVLSDESNSEYSDGYDIWSGALDIWADEKHDTCVKTRG